MKLKEDVLAKVVAEVSAGHTNPRFVEETVGAFMRKQPIIGNYVASHQKELAVEGIVLVLLHAAILCRAIERAGGHKIGAISAPQLDAAARGQPDEPPFGEAQPAIRDYMSANVSEDPTLAKGKRRELALSLLRLCATALIEAV